MSETIIRAIYLAILIVLAVCDVKTRKVPLAVNAGALFLILCYRFITHTFTTEQVVTAIVLFLILWVGVRFWGLGGADAITGGIFGLYLGFSGIFAVLLAFLFSLPYLIRQWQKGNKRPDYGFLPYMAAGYGVTFLLILLPI